MKDRLLVVQYNPDWPKQFVKEKIKLLPALGKSVQAIEHIGSTAIIGLAAKPTIDILIGVESLNEMNLQSIQALAALQYDYLPKLENQLPERRFFQKLNQAGDHLIHLHITEFKKPFWQRHTLFRNYLIAHPDRAKLYADLKIKLASQFKEDRQAYTRAKFEFCETINQEAIVWSKNNNLEY
ncbi:MAG: hypothetical protein A3E87_10270 [Gammaproteobacteria bacterium RIFCSPHIGHO2_12_FULL_35_23]|nr:MAG: hypothetical protein A3E87_10270 [Gammaproteobacteria bacterium RIFCSPHIGHO2_12_FULL_35_23]